MRRIASRVEGLASSYGNSIVHPSTVINLEASGEVKDRIRKLNERLARYVPPRETWTPAEEALYKPVDLYRVPMDEARAMQLKAIKHAFTRQYTLNRFYRSYCEMRGTTPEHIRTYDDLEKIPLLPDLTFKQHPSGEDFAYWITVIFTGDLPRVIVKGGDPTFDGVIKAFNEAGLTVALSSGTSGRHTVIPRDIRTQLNWEYAVAKLHLCMLDIAADHRLLLWPNPTKTNLAIAVAHAFWSELYDGVEYALDLEMGADLTFKAMADEERHAPAPPSAEDRQRTIIETVIKWLERYARTTDTIGLVANPFLIHTLMDTLEREGIRFEFGERAMLHTGGGWKVSEDQRVSVADFRKRVEEVLGIPETRCLDMYGMSEMMGMTLTCPEGHYLHLPYAWIKPLVLDSSLALADYGERGRFAFLDGLAASYPGFIMSGDEVRMLEHCPVCDRPGPVLEPEIRRAKGQEMRGCAEVLRRVLAQTILEDN